MMSLSVWKNTVIRQTAERLNYLEKVNNSYMGNQACEKMRQLLTLGEKMYKKDLVFSVCLSYAPCLHSHRDVNVDYLTKKYVRTMSDE